MDIFDDRKLLTLVFVILSIFFGGLVVWIALTEGIENAIFPAVLFPCFFVLVYFMNREAEKSGKQAACQYST